MSNGPGDPPVPFDPLIETLAAGTMLWRVHPSAYAGNAFHPGGPSAGHSRFSFFGTPNHVPVLYLGESEECSIAETILHGKVRGSAVRPNDYVDRVLSQILVGRELRLASFKGIGLARLGTTAGQLTASSSRYYDQTRPWAEAAHAVADLDGIVWMSARFNEHRSFMLFGGRVNPSDLDAGAGAMKIYGAGKGLDTLADICRIAKVKLHLPRP